MGTMHPVFREDIRVPKNMLRALLAAQQVFFEHDFTNPNDSATIARHLMEKPILPRVLGEICYEMLCEKLAAGGDTMLSKELRDQLQPVYLGGRLLRNHFGSELTSVDAIIMAIALGNGQQISFLDSPEQLRKLAALQPLDQQAEQLYLFLQHYTETIDLYTQNVKRFTQLYYTGQLDRLYRQSYYGRDIFAEGMRLKNEFVNKEKLEAAWNNQLQEEKAGKKLIDDRNKSWLPAIITAAAQQACFFAVGAAHLAGPKGLLRLLRKKGFTVTPVPLELQ